MALTLPQGKNWSLDDCGREEILMKNQGEVGGREDEDASTPRW